MSNKELICPVCNGLEILDFYCPNCSHLTNDCGLVNNYWGPYSPYEANYNLFSSKETDFESEICIHLVSCPECEKDTRVSIKKVLI